MTYRDDTTKAGDDYVRFVVDWLGRRGVRTRYYLSKHDQIAHGDVDLGMEIKFDRKMRDTGNLFVETAERRDAAKAYVASGIYAGSDARWYWIGDYHEWFVFRRDVLRGVAAGRKELEIGMKTSRGFLIPRVEAASIAAKTGHFDADDLFGSIVGMPLEREIRWS